jgi:Ca-activated chloride channel homolog
MNFNNDLGQTEYIFIVFFVGLYILYFVRTVWIAYRLKITSRAVVLKFFLRCVYFAFLLMALLEPSFGELEATLKAQGKDIFFVIDVSKSMDVSDVQPTRLEKIKFELTRLTKALGSSRMGIVSFKSEAQLTSPLTFDQSSLALFLDALNTDNLPDDGTDISVGLQMTVEKLLNKKTSQKKSKIIVLISDGEDFGSIEATLLNRIRRFGINVFVVGVGTVGGGVVKQNNTAIVQSGDTVKSYFNEKILRRLAKDVKGKFFKVTNTENQIPELIQAIKEVKGNLIDQRKANITANKYYYFLAIALVLLCMDILFTVRILQV